NGGSGEPDSPAGMARHPRAMPVTLVSTVMVDATRQPPVSNGKDKGMKYLCLVYLDQENWNSCPDSECFGFAGELLRSGRLLAAEPLHPGHTATTVRVRNGQMSLYDGPFAETKEVLAGFYLIDAR